MKLPGGEHAICDAAKVRDYLLSREHPVGRWKARFFESLGFTHDEWPALRIILLQLGRDGDAELAAATVFGQKYAVRGIIHGLNGGSAPVVAV